MFRIVMNKDCNLTEIAANYTASKFFKYYLFIKKTSSSVLSAVCLSVWSIYISNVKTLKLTAVYSDAVISVDVAVILNVIRS